MDWHALARPEHLYLVVPVLLQFMGIVEEVGEDVHSVKR